MQWCLAWTRCGSASRPSRSRAAGGCATRWATASAGTRCPTRWADAPLAETALQPLTDADLPVLERLWQLYSHDVSEVRGTLPDAEGRYKPGPLPGYLDDPGCDGFLIRYGEAPAGFAFVKGVLEEPRSMGDS